MSGSSMLAATRWVVMGDVLNAAKPASRIVRRLLDNNKTVHLVNPRAPSAAGASPVVHSSLSAVLKDNPVDVVDVVINPAESVTHMTDGQLAATVGSRWSRSAAFGCAVSCEGTL
jgi:predicted CoA-binding protein